MQIDSWPDWRSAYTFVSAFIRPEGAACSVVHHGWFQLESAPICMHTFLSGMLSRIISREKRNADSFADSMPDAGSSDRTAMYACRRARPALLARNDATASRFLWLFHRNTSRYIATASEFQQQMKSQLWSQYGQIIQSASFSCGRMSDYVHIL